MKRPRHHKMGYLRTERRIPAFEDLMNTARTQLGAATCFNDHRDIAPFYLFRVVLVPLGRRKVGLLPRSGK